MSADSRFTPNGIVTLTTDFGTSDGYVGAMKGVLLSHAAGLTVLDVAHEIGPQNVAHGAAVLRTACPWFPTGTVHVAVVDPGVGTERSALVLLAGGHIFVGPDNGLLTLAADALGGATEARRIDPTGALASVLPESMSATFHGRDVFAPTGAALASGHLPSTEVGPVHEPVRLSQPAPTPEAGGFEGSVTHVDRFGNAVTNISATHLPGFPKAAYQASAGGEAVDLVATYAAVTSGAVCALVGSDGFVEIAVRDGSAADQLGLGSGSSIRVLPASRA
ncbi:MAG: SAM-dependent chlorinase/fluorinase [Candidatus Binatia bacterium]|nr:SAM-dependent chlorinase/fluorinase [Candidatus Binatia bacterium]